jgi:hypothetical protein
MDTEATLRKRRSPSWKENQRQKRESFWIRELQTLHPEGINK